MTKTWAEAQRPWDEAAKRVGIHTDDVQSWMLDQTNRCDGCSKTLLSGAALCETCRQRHSDLAAFHDPINIAIRQGCVLVLSDGKRDGGAKNATTDKDGKFGLHLAGGV